MPLLKNTNQPFFPDPNSPNEINCAGSYCYPVAVGDKIKQQWIQTPCGTNEIADPQFGNAAYGSNLITNGTFAGSLASWTTTGWVYNTGQAEAPALTPVNDLTQAGVLVADFFYRITFDLSGLSPGDELHVYLGNAASYYVFDQNDSVDVIIRRGSDNTDIVFVAAGTNNAQLLLDNVTLQVATFGDWDTNSTWTLNAQDGMACATGIGTGLLEEAVSDYIVVGDYYQLTFTVSNYISGSVTPYIANMPGTAITANGTYTIYDTPTLTGVVSFLPSADFVGCISFPLEDDADNLLFTGLRALRNDFLFEVIDSDGNRYDISDFIEYFEDKVTLDDNVLDQLELLYGCYYIEVTDRCLVEGTDLITNGTFSEDEVGWSKEKGPYQYNISGGEAQFIFDPSTGVSNVLTNGDFASGSAGWTFAGWTIGSDATHTPGNTSPLSRSVTIAPVATPPNTQYWWVYITMSGRTAGSFNVTLSDYTSSNYADNGTWAFRMFPSIGGGAVTFSINPTSAFDGTIDDIQIYEPTLPWDESPLLYNTANPDIVAGNYQLTYDITDITMLGSGLGLAWIAGFVYGQSVALDRKYTVASQTTSIPNYVPGLQLPAFFPSFGSADSAGGGRSYPGSMTIDNAVLVRVEPFEATYTSECLDYRLEHLNTKLITGWCDQDAFGFDFSNTGFQLQMRVEIRSLNPVYDKTKNIAQFSSGSAKVAYADQTKFWTLATGLLSESAHDALSTIIDCDHFTIGTSDANAIEYIAEVEDYQPEWTKTGSYALAQILINIRLKTKGMKFNRHT